MKPTWKKYVLYGSAIVVIGAVVLAGYSVTWTGFGDYTLPNGDLVRGKMFWDWLELLVIPSALAIGAFYLNRSEREGERQIAADRQQEAALQSYLDRMTELLLKEKLRASENEEVRNVARIRTLTVLRGLDANRKGLILLFLKESELIDRKAIIDLSGADFNGAYLVSANLRRINMNRANLRAAKLQGANLSGAYINNTDLQGAHLVRADFTEANLNGANFRKAHLRRADFTEAGLRGADFFGADLRGVDFSGADLSFADLEAANVLGAEFSGAILNGAELSEAQLTLARTLEALQCQTGQSTNSIDKVPSSGNCSTTIFIVRLKSRLFHHVL